MFERVATDVQLVCHLTQSNEISEVSGCEDAIDEAHPGRVEFYYYSD